MGPTVRVSLAARRVGGRHGHPSTETGPRTETRIRVLEDELLALRRTQVALTAVGSLVPAVFSAAAAVLVTREPSQELWLDSPR